MEFKDKLKALRQNQGLTQSQLAEKLFVSRSTVAKWENGLGLPNPESMKLLEEHFGVTQKDISTEEPETVIVEKNRRIRWRTIGSMVGWSAMIALLVAMHILPYAIHKGAYGFTPEMAAGNYADCEYIDTGDYRIYYFSFEGTDQVTGQYWSDLQGWKIVEKHFWGYTVDDTKAQKNVLTKDNYVVGHVYTIKGNNGYYNLINKAGHYKVETPGESMIWDIPTELIHATSVTIHGKEYELQDGFFFISQEPVRYFEINNEWYDIE